MEKNIQNKKNKPLLICIPGLLGGEEDFRNIIDPLKNLFDIHVFDPNENRRVLGLSGLSTEAMEQISFDTTADDILKVAEAKQADRVFLCGISLGGKIVYDFATKFPSRFGGAVITDVGPGSFAESTLFQFVEKTVSGTNLNQPWSQLKEDLRNIIPERNLRSLIQSQIHYPQKNPPAAWKMGMRNFEEMLQRQAIDQQWETLEKLTEIFSQNGQWIHLLKSDTLSAISDSDFEKIRKMNIFKIYFIPESSHFLHITHKQQITHSLSRMLEIYNEMDRTKT